MHGVEHDCWLSASNKARYNHGIRDRPPQHQNPLSHFLVVAHCSQPLILPFFDGLLEDFTARLIACWDAHGNQDVYLYEEKRALVMVAADYVAHLSIAQSMSGDQYVRHVQGHEFFQQPSQPCPFEVPLLNSKATLHAKLIEVLWILTTLFHSVGIYTPLPPPPCLKVMWLTFRTIQMPTSLLHPSTVVQLTLPTPQCFFAGLPGSLHNDRYSLCFNSIVRVLSAHSQLKLHRCPKNIINKGQVSKLAWFRQRSKCCSKAGLHILLPS